MNLHFNKGITLKSVVAGIAFAASVAGFDFKDWNPANAHELIRVAVIFALGLAIAFFGLNTQDPSSQAFVRDALAIFQKALSQEPDMHPEIKAAMQEKIEQCKPSEKPEKL